MNSLYIIRGLPGSGKTTFWNVLRDAGLVRHVFAADDWMVDEHGEYRFNASRLKFCHDQCRDATTQALMRGLSVAVCNTFTRIWEMQPYINAARNLNARLVVLTCEGDHGNVHGVPADKIWEMRERFELW